MTKVDASPRLTQRDAELLAALTESSGRRVRLHELVHDYDWLNRAIPTFDELSYGMQRLVAAGFASVRSGRDRELDFQATPDAVRLRKAVTGHPASGMSAAIDADAGSGDRSLGRLPGLTPEALHEAVRAHASWVGRRSRPFLALARVLGWWQRGNRDSSK